LHNGDNNGNILRGRHVGLIDGTELKLQKVGWHLMARC